MRENKEHEEQKRADISTSFKKVIAMQHDMQRVHDGLEVIGGVGGGEGQPSSMMQNAVHAHNT